MKLLARELDARYQNASAVAADIRRITSELDARLDEPAPPASGAATKQGSGITMRLAWLALVALAVAGLWWLLAS
jgi:Flp pilus assembly CpaF family ATPase